MSFSVHPFRRHLMWVFPLLVMSTLIDHLVKESLTDFSTVKLLCFFLWLIQNLWGDTFSCVNICYPFLPKVIITRIAVRRWFANSLIPSVFINWDFIVKKCFLFLFSSLLLFPLPLPSYSFLSVWTCGFLCYSMGHHPLPPLLILLRNLS